jgi:hypothetical protein
LQFLISKGAKPSGSASKANTLTLAVKTQNLEIVKEILLIGGTSNNKKGMESTICVLCKTKYPLAVWNNMVNSMIELIMCSGVKLMDDNYKYMGIRKCFVSKLDDCYALLNNRYQSRDDSYNLKTRLIITMDQLTNKSLDKKNKINEMKDIMKYVSISCIDIIYEYQYVQPLVKFIDWSKY